MVSLSNREIAVYGWTIMACALAMLNSGIRKTVKDLVCKLLSKEILAIVISAELYLAAIIIMFHAVGLWSADMLKETLVWAIFTAISLIIEIPRALKKHNWFKEIVVENIGFGAMLFVVVDMRSFSLPIEIVLFPIVAILTLLLVFAEHKPEHKQIIKPIRAVLAFIGLVMLVWSVIWVLSDYAGLFSKSTFLTFTFIPMLSVAFIPFLYTLSLFFVYEDLYRIIDFHLRRSNSKLSSLSKLKIFLNRGVDLYGLQEYIEKNRVAIINVNNVREVMKIFSQVMGDKRHLFLSSLLKPPGFPGGFVCYMGGVGVFRVLLRIQ